MARDLRHQLRRPRVGQATIRHRRHQPQRLAPRHRLAGRGLARQSPSLPECRRIRLRGLRNRRELWRDSTLRVARRGVERSPGARVPHREDRMPRPLTGASDVCFDQAYIEGRPRSLLGCARRPEPRCASLSFPSGQRQSRDARKRAEDCSSTRRVWGFEPRVRRARSGCHWPRRDVRGGGRRNR